jgi:hypothetical protein
MRGTSYVAISLCAILGGSVLAPDSATAGSISGHVYVDATTQPLAGANVNVEDPSVCVFGGCASVGSTISAADGSYVVSDLPAKTLRATAYYDWNGPSYSAEAPVYFDGSSDLAPFDLYMTPAASISGRVTRASDGTGVANVNIYQCIPNDTGVSNLLATTDASGNYAATQLDAGDYILCVTGTSPFQGQFYSGRAVSPPSQNNQAYDTISLTTGQTFSNADFILTEGGHIRGALTDRYSGLPIANQTVYFSAYDTLATTYPWLSFAATTDALGHYEIAGLPNSQVYLGAYEDSPSYALSVYGCSPDPCAFANATPLLAAAGTTLDNIDMSLFPDWVITGHVSVRSNGQPGTGQPVVGATVNAFGDLFIGPGIFASTTTDANGDYALVGVPINSFVEVSNASVGGVSLISQDYNNRNCDHGWCATASADLLTRNPYNVTPDIDFQLDAGATLSGLITNAADGSAAVAMVEFYSAEAGSTAYAYSHADGSYTSPALTPGTYYIYALRSDAAYPIVSDCEIYGGIPCDTYITNVTSGTPVTIVGTQSQTGFNIALLTESIFSNGFE